MTLAGSLGPGALTSFHALPNVGATNGLSVSGIERIFKGQRDRGLIWAEQLLGDVIVRGGDVLLARPKDEYTASIAPLDGTVRTRGILELLQEVRGAVPLSDARR